MTCTPEKVLSVPIMVKLNKISSYLSSFQADKLSFKRNSLLFENEHERNGSSEETGIVISDHQNERATTCPSFTSDKIKDYYCTNVKVPSQQPLNNFRCRIKTFGDVSWMLPCNIVSVYECVRRGWYLLQQDMLCCCSCNEMVCLQLPPSHSSSYDHAVSILRNRVLNKHKDNCRYRNCAEPVAIARPPFLLTTPHLYSLAAAAHQLASGASTAAGVGLPYMENGGKDAMDRLEVSSSMLQEIWGSVREDGWQHLAVLLVLCGWKATTTPDTIRCELCQRSIGLWHFLSYAEHQEREAAVAASVLSEMGQPTAETTGIGAEAGPEGNLDNSEATTELSEDLLQKTEEESSASKRCDTLIVPSDAGGSEKEGNDGAEEGRAPADNIRSDGDVLANNSETVEEGAASGDLSQGTEMEGNCDSKQKSITNQDEHKNVTSSSGPQEETETRNKRKRSECEDDEQDQSKLESEANDECSKALHSKRSKSLEDSQAPDSEPLPASPGVSVEESTPSAVTQVSSKPLFCPFTQHRYWCGWVCSQKVHPMASSESVASTTNSPSGNTSNGGPDVRLHRQDTFSEVIREAAASSANDSLKGYAVFARELKSVLQLAQRKQWTASDKYAKNIDGLRCVRAHLTSWAK